jgi:hypothetical protein
MIDTHEALTPARYRFGHPTRQIFDLRGITHRDGRINALSYATIKKLMEHELI